MTQNQIQDELVIERTFDASPKQLFHAWTDQEIMKQWWGPKEFTAPVCEIDLRVGGKYLCCMRDPEGNDYWSTGVYKEIIPNVKLVCTDSFADNQGNVVPSTHYGMEGIPLELLVTITFENVDGKTLQTIRHTGMPAGKMQEMTGEGWNQMLDKLVNLLASG